MNEQKSLTREDVKELIRFREEYVNLLTDRERYELMLTFSFDKELDDFIMNHLRNNKSYLENQQKKRDLREIEKQYECNFTIENYVECYKHLLLNNKDVYSNGDKITLEEILMYIERSGI